MVKTNEDLYYLTQPYSTSDSIAIYLLGKNTIFFTHSYSNCLVRGKHSKRGTTMTPLHHKKTDNLLFFYLPCVGYCDQCYIHLIIIMELM